MKWVCNTLEGCLFDGFDGNDSKISLILGVQSGFRVFGGYIV